MKLFEAIKSGRPFRAYGSGDPWMVMQSDGYLAAADKNPLQARRPPTKNEYELDYEIQEPSVTVTATAFWEAAESAFGFTFKKCSPFTVAEYTGPAAPPIHAVEKLARALGLAHD